MCQCINASMQVGVLVRMFDGMDDGAHGSPFPFPYPCPYPYPYPYPYS